MIKLDTVKKLEYIKKRLYAVYGIHPDNFIYDDINDLLIELDKLDCDRKLLLNIVDYLAKNNLSVDYMIWRNKNPLSNY